MDKITEAIEKLNVSVTKLTERVANLESSAEVTDATTRQTETETSTHQTGVSLEPTASGQVFTAHSYLKDFDQLKDKLAKIPLPPHLKLSDSSAGIKAESKPVTKVIAKAARFGETGLRLLASISSSQGDSDAGYQLSEEDIGSLYTIFAAQIQFMQQEYAGIIVKNTFDEETSRLFRQFENHTSAFSASQLANVRVAAELASISSRRNAERGRGRGDRNFNTPGRGRGFGSVRGGGYNRMPGPGYNGGFLPRNDQLDRRD